MTTTKERILDAAEALFSDQGFTTTSLLRSITAASEVNLAAVNYHFGSKEQLIAKVFEVDPLRCACGATMARGTGARAAGTVSPPVRTTVRPQPQA